MVKSFMILGSHFFVFFFDIKLNIGYDLKIKEKY